MKNIELWSRATDRKILIGLGLAFCLGVAAFAGWLLPEPVQVGNIQLLGAFITVMLLVFVWAGFRLLRPLWYRRGWVIAEIITVPLTWALLVVLLGLWFAHLNGAWDVKLELIVKLVQGRPAV